HARKWNLRHDNGLQIAGKRLQGRTLEEHMQWHLASQNRTEARDCTHREQRIAAKLEEIVAHTYAIDSEQIGQDLCQRCLDLGTRSDVLNAAATIAVRCMPHFFGDI